MADNEVATGISKQTAIRLLQLGQKDESHPNVLLVSGLNETPTEPVYTHARGDVNEHLRRAREWNKPNFTLQQASDSLNQFHEEHRQKDLTTLDQKLESAGADSVKIMELPVFVNYSSYRLYSAEGYSDTFENTLHLNLPELEKIAGMSYTAAQSKLPASERAGRER